MRYTCPRMAATTAATKPTWTYRQEWLSVTSATTPVITAKVRNTSKAIKTTLRALLEMSLVLRPGLFPALYFASYHLHNLGNRLLHLGGAFLAEGGYILNLNGEDDDLFGYLKS